MSALGILLTLLPLDPAVGQSDGDHPAGWRATGFLLGTGTKPALAAGSVAPSAGSRDHTFDTARQRYAQALAAAPGLTGKQTEAALRVGRPPGKQLLLLDHAAAAKLVQQGWHGLARGTEDLARQADRIRTLAAVARRMNPDPVTSVNEV